MNPKMNPMREIRVSKVTLNIGAGKDTTALEKGEKLLSLITVRKPVRTITNKRIPTWGVRPGLPLGVKVTLRSDDAVELLKRMLEAKEKKLKLGNFGKNGDLSFGVHEYIDVPGMRYDPQIGIIGFDVCVTLERPGYRIKRRRLMARTVPARHRITSEEAVAFMKERFGVEVEE